MVEMAGVQLQLKAATRGIADLTCEVAELKEKHAKCQSSRKHREHQEEAAGAGQLDAAAAGTIEPAVQAVASGPADQVADNEPSSGLIPPIATMQPYPPGTRYVEINEVERPTAQALLPPPSNVELLAALSIYAAEDAAMADTPMEGDASLAPIRAGSAAAEDIGQTPTAAHLVSPPAIPADEDTNMTQTLPDTSVSAPEPLPVQPPSLLLSSAAPSAPASPAPTSIEAPPLPATISAPAVPDIINRPDHLDTPTLAPPPTLSSATIQVAPASSLAAPVKSPPAATMTATDIPLAPAPSASDVEMADAHVRADIDIEAGAIMEADGDGKSEDDAPNEDADGDNDEDTNVQAAVPDVPPAVASRPKKRERANSNLPPRAPSKRVRRMPPQ